MKWVQLTPEQAAAILAFIESFENVLTGCWAPVAAEMTETHGIEDPEAALEDATAALRG